MHFSLLSVGVVLKEKVRCISLSVFFKVLNLTIYNFFKFHDCPYSLEFFYFFKGFT